MGDGAFHPVLIVIFFFINRKFFWTGLISFILIAILSPLFKRVIYPDTARPSVFFKNLTVHYVDGVTMAHANSFPSGHTMTAFAWGLWLAVYFQKTKWVPFIFLMSVLVAFSRVYLLQHFIGDIFGGSVFGVLSMLGAFYIYNFIVAQWGKKTA